MNPESFLRIEEKLDEHIKRHDEDYKRLLFWIISTIIGLVIGGISIFVTWGATLEKVSQLEKEQDSKVDRQELQAAISLIDNKFENINDKLDDIKEGLNIK
jgi:hypothetical protein